MSIPADSFTPIRARPRGAGQRETSQGIDKILRGIVALFFFVAPISGLVTIGGVRSSRWMGFLLIAAAAASLLMRGRVGLLRFHAWLGIFFFWALLSLFWADNVSYGSFYFINFFKGFIFLLAIWQISHYRQHYEQFLDLFLLGTLFAMLLTLPAGLDRLLTAAVPGNARFSGALDNPNVYAQTIAATLPFVMHRFTVVQGHLRRMAFLMLIALSWYTVLLAGSRGGMVCALFATAMMLYLETSALRAISIGLAGIGLLLLSLNVIQLPPDMLDRLAGTLDELQGGTLSSRTTIWDAGWRVFAEQPVLGVGIGNFWQATLPFIGEIKVAHNTYLSMLVETGLVGFTLFMAAFIVLYRTVRAGGRHNAAARISLLTLALSAMTTSHGIFLVPWCLLALIAGMSSQHGHSTAVMRRPGCRDS